MPVSEILNALLITYIATEYSVASSSSSPYKKKNQGFILVFVRPRIHQVCLVTVFLWNVLDYYDWSGISTMIKTGLEQLLHAPKIVFAALLYMTVLYFDCLRHATAMTTTTDYYATASSLSSSSRRRCTTFLPRYLKHVACQFLYILPVYPFLAVLISFGFMFVISAMEHLHLPLEWLNWPIYYGTLYGPFSLVYFKVKNKILQEEEEAYYFIPSHYHDPTRTTRTSRGLPSDFFQRLSSSDSNNDDDNNNHDQALRYNRMATIRDLRLMKLEPIHGTKTEDGAI